MRMNTYLPLLIWWRFTVNLLSVNRARRRDALQNQPPSLMPFVGQLGLEVGRRRKRNCDNQGGQIAFSANDSIVDKFTIYWEALQVYYVLGDVPTFRVHVEMRNYQKLLNELAVGKKTSKRVAAPFVPTWPSSESTALSTDHEASSRLG